SLNGYTSKTVELLTAIRKQLDDENRPFGIAPARHLLVDEDLDSFRDFAWLLAEVQAADEQLRAVATVAGGDPAPTEQLGPALERRKAAYRELLAHLENLRARGEQPSEAPQDLTAEQTEALEHVFDVLDEVFEDDGDSTTADISDAERTMFVAAVRAVLDELRHAVVRKLAKSWQKPDHCIRRQTVLRESVEVYFPATESFDEHWYVG